MMATFTMSLISFVVFLSLISTPALGTELIEFQCEPEWELMGTHCYYYINVDLDFHGARHMCETYGSKLVSIRDEVEGKEVGEKAQDHFSPKDSFWIANYRDNQSLSDKSPIGVYGFWQVNEPRDLGMWRSAISSDFHGRWKISSSNEIRPFVCRVPACPKNTYRCSEGKCISNNLKCDGHYDCHNGLDESACTAQCTKHMKADSGTVSLNSYDNNVHCSWILEASPGKVLKLVFQSIDLEGDVDVLKVYTGGRTRESSHLVSRDVARDSERTFYSPNNFFLLEFISDSSVRKAGFSATFMSVSELEKGRVMIHDATNEFQEITTPFFTANQVPPYMTTEWKILADPGELIVLEVLSPVERDLIVVNDIGTEINMKHDHMFAVISKDNELRLVVKTKKKENSRFRARFKKGCNIDLSVTFATISVRDMRKDNGCMWSLTNSDNLKFKAMAHMVEFQENRESYMKIFDGTAATGDLMFTGNRTMELDDRTLLGTTTGNRMDIEYFSHRDSQMPDDIMVYITSLCAPFPDESHLIKTEPDSTTMANYSISISCDVGYNFLEEEYHQDMEVTCAPYGKWMFGKPSNTRFPSCQIVYCGIPPQIENGFVESHGGNVTYEGTVKYVCANGFDIDGDHTINCQANGNWSKPPSCLAGNCGQFAPIDHATFEYVNGEASTSYGTIIDITCKDGYELHGAKRVVCRNESWSYESTTCVAITCPMMEIYKGTLKSSMAIQFDTTVELECDDHFVLVNDSGSAIDLKCEASRMLSGTQQCVDQDECSTANRCGPKEVCVNFHGYHACLCQSGYNGTDCARMTEYPYDHCTVSGDTTTCACASGTELFTVNGQNGFYIPPMETGMRESDRFHLDHTCVSKVCSLPTENNVRSLMMTNKTFHYVGDFVEYYCPYHNSLTGDNTSICMESGQFDGNSPTCSQITCIVPNDDSANGLENSRDGIFSNELNGGSHGVINCTDERSMETKLRNIFCLYDPLSASYTLQGDSPMCPAVDCGPIELPGRIVDPDPIVTTAGSAITIECDGTRGFTRDGEGPNGDNKAICQTTGRWDYGTLECKGARCMDPGTNAGTNQLAPNGYEIDQVVTYTCQKSSYTLKPSGKLTCSHDGVSAKWDGSAPICVDEVPPTIICPESFELDLYDYMQFEAVSATDNSGFVRIVQHKGPRSMQTRLVEDTEFQFEAFDHNLSSNCSFTISVRDRSYPTLNCPAGPETLAFTEDSGSYFVHIHLDNFSIFTNSDDITISPEGIQSVNPGQNIPVRVTATKNGLSQVCAFIVQVDTLSCEQQTLTVDHGTVSNCELSGPNYQCLVSCDDGFVLPSYVATETATCISSTWTKELAYYNCYETHPLIQNLEGILFYSYSSSQFDMPDHCFERHSNSLKAHVDSLSSVCGDYTFEMTDMASTPQSTLNMYISFNLKIGNYDDNSTALAECQQKLVAGKTSYFESSEPINPTTASCNYPWTLTSNGNELLDVSDPSCATQQIEILGGSRCVECPRGFTYNEVDKNCVACAAGYYKSSAGPQPCTECPNTGSGIIFAFDGLGAFSASGCVELCPQGFSSATGKASDGCTACASNTYWTGPNECTACPNSGGTENVEAAKSMSYCKDPCPAGEYSKTGYETCLRCPANFYSTLPQQTTCLSCNEDQYTTGTGNDLASSCLNTTCPTNCDATGTDATADCTKEYHYAQCPCKEGFTGLRCETAIDVCTPDPCYNEGTCMPNGTSYTCDCPKKRSCSFEDVASLKFEERKRTLSSPTVQHCQDECLEDDSCKAYAHSNGACEIYDDLHYAELDDSKIRKQKVCNVTAEFTGDYCEVDMENDCQPDTCASPDFCRDLVKDTACVCPTSQAYTQPRCERPDDPCEAANCINGICKKFGNIRYVCECDPGFTGDSCETNINDCSPNPCVFGGTCTDLANSFRCDCPPGYSGDYCEEYPDPCNTADCMGGDCRIDFLTMSAICFCPDHYQRKSDVEKDSCVPILYCNDSPCKNDAPCVDKVGGFTCMCPTGYEGSECQHNINDCQANSCKNQGVCHDKLNGFWCDCPPGFEGSTCEVDIDDCIGSCEPNNFISCDNLAMDFRCHCKEGYTGKNCSETKNLCDAEPCQHGGECTNSFNAYSCFCPEGWTGTDCENVIDYCAINNPCQNDAECFNLRSGPFCRCNGGTAGEMCEIKSDLCDLFGSSLCLHGQCTEEDGDAKCVCTGAVTTCDLVPSAFLSFNSPILDNFTPVIMSNEACEQMCLERTDCKGLIVSGGACFLYKDITIEIIPNSNPVSKIKRCNFDPYYTGSACELKRDHCKRNPCHPDRDDDHDYDYDEYDEDEYDNHGICTIADLSYTCDCEHVDNFEGTQCKTPIEVCHAGLCPSGIQCHTYINDHGLVTPACLCPPQQVLAGDVCKDVDRNYDLVFPMEKEENSFVTSTHGFYIGDEEEITIAFWLACVEVADDWIISIADSTQDPHDTHYMPIVKVMDTQVTLWSNVTTESIPLETPLSEDFKWHFVSISLNKMGQYQIIFDFQISGFEKESHQALHFKLPQDRFYFVHIGGGFYGYMSQVSVWKSLVDSDSLLEIYSNKLHIPTPSTLALGWILYTRHVDIMSDRPSTAGPGVSVCSIDDGITTPERCPGNTYPVRTPPMFNGVCEKEKTLSLMSSNQVTIGRLNYAFFSGHRANNIPNNALTFGAHDVAVTSTDDHGNVAICMSRVYVTNKDCDDFPGSLSETDEPFTLEIACEGDLVPSIPLPVYMSCGKLKSYNLKHPSRHPNEFSCGMSEPLRVTITATFIYQLPISCLEDMADSLADRLRETLADVTQAEWHLCDTECVNADITSVCSQSNSRQVEITIVLHDLLSMLQSTISVSILRLTPAEVLLRLIEDGSFNAPDISGSVLLTNTFSTNSVLNCIEGYGRQGEICVQCGAGTYYVKATEKCVLCPYGTYSNSSGVTECTMCPDEGTTLQLGSNNSSFCIQNCDVGNFYNTSTEECELCPKNFYQDQKGQSSCKPCGPATGTGGTGADALNDCIEFCDPGSELIDNVCVDCKRGFYRVGNIQDRCKECPENTTTIEESSSSESQCSVPKCPSGSFIDDSEEPAICKECDYGQFQPDEDMFECMSCNPMFTTTNMASKSADDCLFFCPAGSERIGDTDTCAPCKRRFYRGGSLAERFVGCFECPDLDFTTPDDEMISVDNCTIERCLAGSFYNTTDGSCYDCPKGSYQDQEQMNECEPCSDNQDTVGTGSTSSDDCKLVCPAGSELDADDVCQQCKRGFFKSVDMQFQQCQVCSENTTDGPGRVSESLCDVAICTPGHVVTADGCSPCPRDTYQVMDLPFTTTTCTPCEGSTGTMDEGNAFESNCTRICVAGQGNQGDACTACPRGTWNNGNTTMRFEPCMNCPDGWTTDSQTGGTSADDCSIPICEMGHVISDDKMACVECAIDSYQPVDHPFSTTKCMTCTSGLGTKQIASSLSSDCIPFCIKGNGYYMDDEECQKCPQGTWNNGNDSMRFDVCEKCPEGYTTSLALGASNFTDCNLRDCDPGKYFNDLDECIECAIGTYQAKPRQSECDKCPTNKNTSSTGAAALSECRVYCFAGMEDDGEENCISCGDDYFKAADSFDKCNQCEGDVTSTSEDRTFCTATFCDKGRTLDGSSCKNCPVKYYKKLRGNSACIICPKNYTTAGEGSGSVEDCSVVDCEPGYFLSPETDMCEPCALGYYKSDLGNFACTKCEGQNTTSTVASLDQADCKLPICEAGNYRVGTSCLKCAIGFYQPEAGNTTCLQCDDGFTTLAEESTQADECRIICPAGQYRDDASNECVDCKVGFYQGSPGQTTCQQCVSNFTTAEVGSTLESDCRIVCSLGYYAISRVQCVACSIGQYQDQTGQTDCESCSMINSYTTSTVGEATTSAEDCYPQCPVGKYLEKSTKMCIDCAVGTFKDQIGLMTECEECPGGKTTLSTGATRLSDCSFALCNKGYHRQLNEQNCQKCEIGTYQDKDNSQVTSCTGCGTGLTTLILGAVSSEYCIGDCDSGYEFDYKANNGNGECIMCETGYFRLKGQHSRCYRCPSGQTTLNPGQSSCIPTNLTPRPARRISLRMRMRFRVSSCSNLEHFYDVILRVLRSIFARMNTRYSGRLCRFRSCSGLTCGFTPSCPSGNRARRQTDNNYVDANFELNDVDDLLSDNNQGGLSIDTEEAVADALRDMTENLDDLEGLTPDFSSVDISTVCLAGAVRQGEECVSCPAGKYHNTITDTCEFVPKGSYTTSAGLTTYQNCSAGKTTSSTGSTSSAECKGLCVFDASYCVNGECEEVGGDSACVCKKYFTGSKCDEATGEDRDNDDQIAMIAGITAGMCVLLFIVLIVVACLVSRSRSRRSKRKSDTSSDTVYQHSEEYKTPIFVNPAFGGYPQMHAIQDPSMFHSNQLDFYQPVYGQQYVEG